jgi:predicted PhzF superfamily epimerase YddE/YHI9
LLEKDIPDALKQKIATEMNLSETAFVVPAKVSSMIDMECKEVDHPCTPNPTDVFQTMSRFSLTWFTPTSEVPLCGHATLASAAVLFFVKNNLQVYTNIRAMYSISN